MAIRVPKISTDTILEALGGPGYSIEFFERHELVLRLCGHSEWHRRNFYPPWILRWFADSDCQACRLCEDWQPTPGHVSIRDFLRREGLPAAWRDDPWLEEREVG